MQVGKKSPDNRTGYPAVARAPISDHPGGPSGDDASGVTDLLNAVAGGDSHAFDRLVPHVYESLQRVARRQLQKERKNHTLTPTALVHEAYLELQKIDDLKFNDRSHFFAAAARTMRHILIDHAVRRRAKKRGGDLHEVPFVEVVLGSEDHVEDLVTLDQAMKRLEEIDPRLVRVVECRFFAGLTIAETADALETSHATVSRDWNKARAWLNREIMRDASRPSDEGEVKRERHGR